MNWNAGDLAKEFKRFKQHCQFTFQGPLSEKSEKAKVNYFMTYARVNASMKVPDA